ncbi:hypothetical protein GOP47_0019624 [Adiantum capillus-veneris]|uniref:Uncharacterized protein n=1 Tax=Adiantum capillus-veneris TaxID=13818 RepID=A0A9D4Z7Z2_ADICA|nr:hypothetical protein GOP47_0019624 [Adiantum capillus-veneris]
MFQGHLKADVLGANALLIIRISHLQEEAPKEDDLCVASNILAPLWGRGPQGSIENASLLYEGAHLKEEKWITVETVEAKKLEIKGGGGGQYYGYNGNSSPKSLVSVGSMYILQLPLMRSSVVPFTSCWLLLWRLRSIYPRSFYHSMTSQDK